MRRFPSGNNQFENYLFLALTTTLVLQSLANPEITLSLEEYGLLEEAYIKAAKGIGSPDIRPGLLLARISKLMSQSRYPSASNLPPHPAAIAAEAKHVMDAVDVVIAETWSAYEESTTGSDSSTFGPIIHASWQRTLGVTIANKAILLCACRTLLPDHLSLESEATALTQNALVVIEDARIYRPLGAVWTVHTLICLWCAVCDAAQKAKVEAALLDYQREVFGPSFELQLDQLRYLQQRLSLQI